MQGTERMFEWAGGSGGEAHLKKILQNNTKRKRAPIQSHGLEVGDNRAPHL